MRKITEVIRQTSGNRSMGTGTGLIRTAIWQPAGSISGENGTTSSQAERCLEKAGMSSMETGSICMRVGKWKQTPGLVTLM